MQKKISRLIKESIRVKGLLLKTELPVISALIGMMSSTIKSGNKILIFGNGGSASDSIHIAAELVGRFRKERRALPAIALTENIATITAISNDYDFERIFERQVEALGKRGDMALGISTSGKSKNVIRGISQAKKMGMKTAVLTGKSRGILSDIADIAVRVPSNSTPRIQEAHIAIGHIACEIIEDELQ